MWTTRLGRFRDSFVQASSQNTIWCVASGRDDLSSPLPQVVLQGAAASVRQSSVTFAPPRALIRSRYGSVYLVSVEIAVQRASHGTSRLIPLCSGSKFGVCQARRCICLSSLGW